MVIYPFGIQFASWWSMPRSLCMITGLALLSERGKLKEGWEQFKKDQNSQSFKKSASALLKLQMLCSRLPIVVNCIDSSGCRYWQTNLHLVVHWLCRDSRKQFSLCLASVPVFMPVLLEKCLHWKQLYLAELNHHIYEISFLGIHHIHNAVQFNIFYHWWVDTVFTWITQPNLLLLGLLELHWQELLSLQSLDTYYLLCCHHFHLIFFLACHHCCQ